MTQTPAEIPSLDRVIRQAVRDHYAVGDGDEVSIPVFEVILALCRFTVEIGMTAPPGDQRRFVIDYVHAATAAAEISAETGMSIGVALSQLYGERLN